MNKGKYIIIFIIVLFLTVFFGLFHTFFVPQDSKITPDDAEKLCYLVLGEKDEETGFEFSFDYSQTIEKEGKEYHVIRASWLVDNSHMSYIGDFFVLTNGKEIYNGFVGSGEYQIEELVWSE